jgi:hypothetical protein
MAEEEIRRNNPAEFPEGSEGGGTGVIHRPGGEIAEYPAFARAVGYEALMSEMTRVRARLASIEEQLLTVGIRGGHPPRPNEYPEGSEGTGAGVGGLVGGHIPRPEIHEYPVDLLASIVDRLSAIEAQLTSLAGRVDQVEAGG